MSAHQKALRRKATKPGTLAAQTAVNRADPDLETVDSGSDVPPTMSEAERRAQHRRNRGQRVHGTHQHDHQVK
jgi:hypothetical protein